MPQPKLAPIDVSARDCVRRNLAVVKRTNAARFIPTLEQEFLEELKLQKMRTIQEAKKYKKMVKFAMTALRSGAKIEPGLHGAELITLRRRGYRVKAMDIEKLVVT